MKTLILILALSGSSVFATDTASYFKGLGLSPACETKIENAVFNRCNKDSKNDPQREHECYLDDVNVKRNQSDSAYFEASFTVIDAVIYAYGVSIEDKAACNYKIVKLNN